MSMTNIQEKIDEPILGLLNETRNSFGLRHQDYTRYRKYCTRKIHGLRKGLGLLHKGGPKKNRVSDELTLLKDKKEVFGENKSYFELLLFLCERAWSYGMEIKASLLEDSRKRNHLLSRLRKAANIASFIDLINSNKLFSVNKVLEVKAYTTMINGYYYFEKEEWEKCLEYFTASKFILENLAQGENCNAQDEALYFSMVDNIEPNIRFCLYNIEKEVDELNEEEYNKEIVSKVKGSYLKEFSSHLESITLKSDLPKKVNDIKWFHHTIQLRSSEIARLMIAAKEAEDQLFSNNNNSKDEVMNLYDKIISSYSDATQIAMKLSEEDKVASERIQTSKSAELSANLSLLKACVHQRQFSAMILRNLFLIEEYFVINNEGIAPELKITGRIEDIIKLLNGIIQVLDNISNAPFFQEEYEFEQWVKAKLAYFKGVSQTFMGMYYLNEQKYLEASSLFEHSSSSFSQFLVSNNDSVQSEYKLDCIVSMDYALNFEKIIRSLSQQAQSTWAIHSENETDLLAESLSNLNLSHQQILLSISQQLKQYPNFKLNNNQYTPNLIDLPPKLLPIPCKPMVFDLAFNHFEDENSLLFNHLNNLMGKGSTSTSTSIPAATENAEEDNSGVLGNLFSFFKK
ncbi:hypothetical protein K502DRAFT_344256 [Neoconidiobolus thromboides FSU 785]|nr:hypothetical protein K502DRAFT_344256 [Neoconidiobolus thromboides FSU 785]